MPSIVFGVLDVAYSDAHGSDGETVTKTTGEVATRLEERYHVMQTFFDLRKGEIAEALAGAMAVRLQDLFRGEATPGSPLHGAEQKIESMFRTFLDANEMQKLAMALTNQPISMAAAKGISHRKKQPFSKKNKARPAFVDTGLYRSSMRVTIKL